jgi:hypothetical protein
MPDARERVLAFYIDEMGRKRIEIAYHIPPLTVLACDFFDYDFDDFVSRCVEHDGEDYVIEGWWEGSWEAEINFELHYEVTHWLPEPPGGHSI